MTDKPRNWQEDMKLLKRYGDSDIPYNASEFSNALPYWLQQYDIELRGRKRWAEVAKGLGDDIEQQGKEMIRLQKVIQQKDAEIAELKRLAEFWESQYSDASTHGDETEERLNAELNRLNSLLQDEGDTP
ncbi:hypothetical protein [Paenibacillus brasilensis]|uniref:Uncharacterized protein n=1 Tax=Paenibacillus brasilensis TaxID=128574 RepID=A0ABU0L7M9_9BACL|nr:hypothetical protein [Paenibacillus brasilensis]MDQ0497308.1 hypothetical protein [Paenibacillus brasilensis]